MWEFLSEYYLIKLEYLLCITCFAIPKVNRHYAMDSYDRVKSLRNNVTLQKRIQKLYMKTPLEDSEKYGFTIHDMLLYCNFKGASCDSRL